MKRTMLLLIGACAINCAVVRPARAVWVPSTALAEPNEQTITQAIVDDLEKEIKRLAALIEQLQKDEAQLKQKMEQRANDERSTRPG